MKKNKGPLPVFIAIVLAIIFGSLVGDQRQIFGVSFYAIVDALGILFLNALNLVVVPLVASSIIVGVSRMGGEEGFKRLGIKMFTFYLGTSLLAIIIGLFFVDLIAPGRYISSLPSMQEATHAHVSSEGATLFRILISIVPPNIIDALSKGNMLGLIFFSLIFGYCVSKVETQAKTAITHFFQGLFQAMIQFTHLILKLLPYGVFCLVSKVFMTTGIKSLGSVALFFITTLIGLAVFMFLGLPFLLKYVAKVKPMRHFKAMSPALITAFSTSSSSATLPITINCVEKRAGVSNRICSLVVPLGTSVNMSGSALYVCVATMFVGQAYGIDLSPTTQVLIVAMSLLTSIGVAGIPSASLVAILVLFKVLGLPAEGLGLFIAVDRILDMCRATVNVFSDSCCAVLVAKSEGEKQVLASDL